MTRESLRRIAAITLVLAWSASCNTEELVPTDASRFDGPRMDVISPGPNGDTYLNIDNVNYSTVEQINLYTWPDNKIANAILLKFDLSTIPPGSTISSATLNLYLFSSDATADPTYTATVHKVINKNPVIASATGDTYDGTNSWTPTGEAHPLAQNDIGPAVDTKAIDKTAGFKQWTVTSIVQEWFASPSTNFGLLVNSDPSKLRDRWRFFRSSEYPTEGQRPLLTIVYTPPGGASDEPVFNSGAGDVMIYQDNMDQYTTPQAMDTWPVPSFHPYWPVENATHYAVINPGRAGKGLRLVYDGTNNFPDGEPRFFWALRPENNTWYTPATSATVVQYWVRISKNDGPGGGPGYGSTAKGMKWVELWKLPTGVTRSQFGVTAGNATTGPLWHLHPAGCTGDCHLGFQPVGPYWNQVNNNQWHRVTYLYQPASPAGATNGIARMWVDGTKIVDISAAAAGTTPPGGTKVWCTTSELQLLSAAAIGHIHLGEYMNGVLGDGVTDLPMALDFDDFKWWKLPARVQ